MKIAVIGSGAVGRTLAGRLAGLGHDVAVGTRDVRKTLAVDEAGASGTPPYRDWQQEHPTAQLLSFRGAAAFGEIVLNAVNGMNALAAMRSIGADTLAGKVLLDLALPLDLSDGFPPSLVIANTDSLSEQIQSALPDTRVVKSLNTVYMAVMVDPARVPGDHNLFLSGNDAQAKQVVRELLQQFGWPAERLLDLGGLETARGVEMYSGLFFSLHGRLGTFDFNIAVTHADGLTSSTKEEEP